MTTIPKINAMPMSTTTGIAVADNTIGRNLFSFSVFNCTVTGKKIYVFHNLSGRHCSPIERVHVDSYTASI